MFVQANKQSINSTISQGHLPRIHVITEFKCRLKVGFSSLKETDTVFTSVPRIHFKELLLNEIFQIFFFSFLIKYILYWKLFLCTCLSCTRPRAQMIFMPRCFFMFFYKEGNLQHFAFFQNEPLFSLLINAYFWRQNSLCLTKITSLAQYKARIRFIMHTEFWKNIWITLLVELLTLNSTYVNVL